MNYPLSYLSILQQTGFMFHQKDLKSKMNSYSKTVTNTNNVTVTADNDLIYEKYKPISIITQ